jgi:hypothetical protein
VAFFACLTFWNTFDYPISRRDETCHLKSWGYWQPSNSSGGNPAFIAVKCMLPDGKLISLSQPLGWTPPDVGSEIKIEIVNSRLSGPYYHVK